LLVTSLLSFLLVIGVLVFVHELGHFAAARLFGVRVLTCSLGFGPKLLRLRRGDTEYCVGAVPFGGYVTMAGERAAEGAQPQADEFMSKPKWQRGLILLAGPAMNVVLTVVILTGMLLYGIDVPGATAQDVTRVQAAPLQAMSLGAWATLEMAGQILGDIAGLFSGHTSVQQLIGPVGIAQMAGQSAQIGWMALLGLMAFISLSLGIFNLLPIPVLDGGHIAMLVVEGIRGRELTLPVRRTLLGAGLLFLLMVTATVFVNDINRAL
jgi:regulator of sigma E protease